MSESQTTERLQVSIAMPHCIVCNLMLQADRCWLLNDLGGCINAKLSVKSHMVPLLLEARMAASGQGLHSSKTHRMKETRSLSLLGAAGISLSSPSAPKEEITILWG